MHRRAPLIRMLLLAVAVAVSLLPPAPLRAQAAPTLTATPSFEGNYTPGSWLPIDVRLRNDGPPIQALIAAALPDPTFRNVQPVDLPAGAEKRLTLYVAMEQSVRELRVTLEAGGTVLAEQVLEVRPRSGERLLGILAARDPRLRLPRRQDLDALPFTSVSLSVATLPDRAAGLSSLGLLLIRETPAEGLSPAQSDALAGWVSGGGHLIIGGGPAAAQTMDALPPLLQPAAIGAATQIADAPLAALAGATGPGPLPGVALSPAPDTQSAGPETAPAWVTRSIGQGAVTQLAFDPGLSGLADWEEAPQFWDQLLRSPTLISTPFGVQPRADVIQEQFIGGALTTLPAIRLPPTDLIFLILAAYTILVGPGLALLLRRYDRQAWMWVAVPATALVVGALVFGLAFITRADQRVINQLSLVESVDVGKARARTYIAALSPQSQTLAAELTAPALVRPVRGATGMYGDVSGAGGDIVQAASAVDLRIERWQLQGLMAEEQLDLAGISAAIVVDADGPQVELYNDGDQILRGAVAVYGERVVFLGDLRPGERAAAPWPSGPLAEVPRSTAISYLVLRDELDAGRLPGQAPDRRVLAREALINAAVARGSAGADEGPLLLAWLDQSPLSFALSADGAARQDTTLLVIHPAFVGSGPVALPEGWLRSDLTTGDRAPCNGNQGAGVPAAPAPATLALRLPSGLAALRAEALRLTLDSSGSWPNAGVTTELYDWEQGRWVEQDFDGPGDLELSEAGSYLRGGSMLVRLNGPIASAACLYASAELRGVMP